MWKVIIADDEKLICRLVEALVDWEGLGLEIVGKAVNGLEALELVKDKQPNILITDIRMPGCDGLELIRQARELCSDIEIVIISGYAHFEYAQTAIAYGVGNYILKPIKQDELNETLQKIVSRLKDNHKSSLDKENDHQNSRNDLKRLREGLIKDVLDESREFTVSELKQNYHFHVEEGILQAFVLKIDFDPEKTGEPAFSIIMQKAEELFLAGVPPVCTESLLTFRGFAGYGILNYLPERRDEVRHRMREFLRQMEASKNLFGKVEFSIGLGRAAGDVTELADSMEEARLAVEERLIEGCGRMLEGTALSNGIDKQPLLEKYAKTVEHAIEVLDEKEAMLADDHLKSAVMGIPNIRGREILEIVLDAGKLFVLRMGNKHTGKLQQEFEFRCRQCSMVEGIFKELYVLQEKIISEAKTVRENEATRPIRIAKQMIMENYGRNVTLDEVCDAVGFSSAYFSAMFKKETGEGFSKYLTRVRIDKAKELLRETNMSVAEVCEAVGYNDRKHFTQTFHKMTGVNPAEFRRLYG
ncbi:MAG: response regulator [Lachnospiraceae bacterium]|nr:response regulator [Lachnospiraceae bacterium]